jgi:hypothetical protein
MAEVGVTFWVLITLFGSFVATGTNLVFPNSRIWGFALTLVGIIGLLLMIPAVRAGIPVWRWKFQEPPPLLSALIALLACLLATALHTYLRSAALIHNAFDLIARLKDFAQMSRARLGNTFSLTPAELDAKQRALHEQYLDTFGEEVRRVHRALTNATPFADLLDTMLGSTRVSVRTLKMPELAEWVANTLTIEATTLQQERNWRPWMKTRLLVTFGVYVGLASVVWSALFFSTAK